MNCGKSFKCLVLVFFTAVLYMNAARADDSVQKYITDIEKKASSVTSYQADMNITIEMMGKSLETKGTVIYKKPDKSKMESEMDMGTMKIKQVSYNDGTTRWIYQPDMKTASRIDIKKVAAETKDGAMDQRSSDISQPFKGYQRDSIKFIREYNTNNEKVLIFQGIPEKSGLKMMNLTPAKIELWIGAGDGLCRRMILFNDEGKEMMTQSYENIKINVEVNDSTFSFVPPEGTQVNDITDASIDMLKKMKE
jgi:outer membrane lipoprotein-sorting protein